MSQSVQGTTAPTLTVVDGIPTTTSVDVARHFGKAHQEVLRRIRNLLDQLPQERASNFAATFTDVSGPNGATRQDPAYRITRDGFTLLAMGFTGKKALQFKLAYIDAFNKMEAQIANPAPAQLASMVPHALMANAVLTGMLAGTTVQRYVTQAILKGDDGWKYQRYLVRFVTDSKEGAPPLVEPLPADAQVLSEKQVTTLMANAFASAWRELDKSIPHRAQDIGGAAHA